MSYTAFVIDERVRERLLHRYPPKFPDVYAHHVTLKMGHHPELLTLNYEPMVVITGHIQTDNLELLLVTVEARSVRPDLKKYHITWSLDKSTGIKPKDSNVAIEQLWDSRTLLVPCIVDGNIQLCD